MHLSQKKLHHVSFANLSGVHAYPLQTGHQPRGTCSHSPVTTSRRQTMQVFELVGGSVYSPYVLQQSASLYAQGVAEAKPTVPEGQQAVNPGILEDPQIRKTSAESTFSYRTLLVTGFQSPRLHQDSVGNSVFFRKPPRGLRFFRQPRPCAGSLDGPQSEARESPCGCGTSLQMTEQSYGRYMGKLDLKLSLSSATLTPS